MSEIMKCPMCGSPLDLETVWTNSGPWYECESESCWFQCSAFDLPRIAAAMEFAMATRTLEDAMEPLNNGKLKMGQALPAIRLAMEDAKACEQRVLEVFGK